MARDKNVFHCPMCGKRVPADASKCPGCGTQFKYATERQKERMKQRGLDPYASPHQKPKQEEKRSEAGVCPECGAIVLRSEARCRECGTLMDWRGVLDFKDRHLEDEIDSRGSGDYWATKGREKDAERWRRAHYMETDIPTTGPAVRKGKARRLHREPEIEEGGTSVRRAKIFLVLSPVVVGVALLVVTVIANWPTTTYALLFFAFLALVLIGDITLLLYLSNIFDFTVAKLLRPLGLTLFLLVLVPYAGSLSSPDPLLLIPTLTAFAAFAGWFWRVGRLEWFSLYSLGTGVLFAALFRWAAYPRPLTGYYFIVALLVMGTSLLMPLQRWWGELVPLPDDLGEMRRPRSKGSNVPTYAGVSLLRSGDYTRALAALEMELVRYPEDEVLWNNKGNALSRMGRHYEALQAYDKALKFNPDYEASWNNKGNSLARQKRYDEALWCYDRALEINPHYNEALLNKREVYARMGRRL